MALITKPQFQQTYRLANETGQLIGGFIRYLESSPYPGRKFRRA